MRIFIFSLIFISFSSVSHADAFDWRFTITCDANEREARVEMLRCDANITEPENLKGCSHQKVKITDDIRVATVDGVATRYLYTPVRSGPNDVGLRSNHPAEFSCRMPYGEFDENGESENDPIFLRLERYPTTFNYNGQCGASPYSAMLTIQTGTASLDFNKPAEKIEMVGRCGWGDPGPISKVVIDADSGEVSTTLYSSK